MKYCQKCVLPDTRPHLTLDKNGICNACHFHEEKKGIDWKSRERTFRRIVTKAKSLKRPYDALIPVSGGKDSTWQVVTCLKYGLKPLALTWHTPGRTELGDQNLSNLTNLGVDHIDITINPNVERQFMLRAFMRFGTPMIPMHLAIFALPSRYAAALNIPFVIWGENSAFEYGGKEGEAHSFKLSEKWVKLYGATNATLARDWVSKDMSERDLFAYTAPSKKELLKKNVTAIFLGYFFSWDPKETYRVAKEHGFRAMESGPKTGYFNFADIDDHFISIHHYVKWMKFGFTRLYDNLSLEIRNGRMTRTKAVELVHMNYDSQPKEDIARFCKYTGLSVKQFFTIADRFRNRTVWKKERRSLDSSTPYLEGTRMKVKEKKPPREFRVGHHEIVLKDCAHLELDDDDQITLVNHVSGSEYDIVRKSWGYYATPSLNGRLVKYGLKAALVKSVITQKYNIFLMEIEKRESFDSYLKNEGHEVVAWLDSDESLLQLESKLRS